jgi:TRAP-type C4-dicarboxylate transport system permease small subunit
VPGRIFRGFLKIAEAVSTAAFAAIFFLFLAGIFWRYVLVRPLGWSDELIMVIFLWMVFLTEAFVIEDREQVTFDVLYDAVSERWRRVILALGAAIVATLFLIALPTIFDYVRFLWREKTDALRWRLDIVYFCFVIYWVAVIVRALARLVRLAGPGWRSEVAIQRPDERANPLG